jgi:alkyl sulfatase BDS1-like metallo-beta-lactamase superfamily hydrolase
VDAVDRLLLAGTGDVHRRRDQRHRPRVDHRVDLAARRSRAVGQDGVLQGDVERSAVNEVVAGSATLETLMASGRLAVEGDQSKLGELLGLLDPPDPTFAIVTP